MRDPYVYENTNVLINKLNIKSNHKLDEAEGAIVSVNIVDLIKNPIEIKSVFDIKRIHKKLFSDLYEWAGKNRIINMVKDEPILDGLSVEYSDYNYIDRDLELLDKKFLSIHWKELHKKETIDTIVLLISKLWRIHSFREGNTRTTAVFLFLFMKQIGFKVNIDFINKHAKFFRGALVIASIDQYSEYEHLTKILMDSVSTKSVSGEGYQTIREYEVEKYEYRKHEYKE